MENDSPRIYSCIFFSNVNSTVIVSMFFSRAWQIWTQLFSKPTKRPAEGTSMITSGFGYFQTGPFGRPIQQVSQYLLYTDINYVSGEKKYRYWVYVGPNLWPWPPERQWILTGWYNQYSVTWKILFMNSFKILRILILRLIVLIRDCISSW